ncbi:MAG TPA: hypothetical protein VK093_00115 [Candidatus Avipropionibacterium sp.]|nr:hypothetical protein [Candidatus Avipropionibacterium sp.]
MEHPMIKRANLTGYPEPQRKVLRSDARNEPIFEDDELLCIEDIEFVAEELSSDAKEVLFLMGAISKLAKK